MEALYWEYGEHKLPFDFDDADDALRYGEAVKALKQAKAPERSADPSAFILAYCDAIGTFFDTIFGEGTAEQLFPDEKINKRNYDAAYISFLHYVAEQAQESHARLVAALEKYTPQDAQTK